MRYKFKKILAETIILYKKKKFFNMIIKTFFLPYSIYSLYLKKNICNSLKKRLQN